MPKTPTNIRHLVNRYENEMFLSTHVVNVHTFGMKILKQTSSFFPVQCHAIPFSQANYLLGDNSNQQLLESIGDSNSSSSFDMERRSFSSNSNQSTIGNYNSDHSVAFSTSSTQQFNGTHSLPSVLSSIATATSSSATATNASNANASSFTYADGTSSTSAAGTSAMASGSMAGITHRKSSLAAIPFTPSPDDRSNNAGDLYSSSTLSAMQSSAHNTSNLANSNHLNSSALNTSATLASLGDYSMQMNDLINDDNGDGLDMTFWENFDNFNYDADLVMSNNNSNSNSSSAQQYSHLLNKSSSKRSFDGTTASERKRKRGFNETIKEMYSKSIPKDLLAKNTSNSSNSNLSLTPTPMDTMPSLSSSKSTNSLSQSKKSSINAAAANAAVAAASIAPLHSNSSSITIDLDTSKSEVICIEDDEDDATNNNNIGGHCCAKMHSITKPVVNIQYDFTNSFFCTYTFDSVDATVNRNSDRENGTIYPVTPTKELNGDFSSTKHHVSGNKQSAHSAAAIIEALNCVNENVFCSFHPFIHLDGPKSSSFRLCYGEWHTIATVKH